MNANKLKFLLSTLVFLASLGMPAGKALATLPAPAGFSAVADDGTVALQWTPVPSATAYALYRTLLVDTPGPSTPTWTPTQTPSGTPTPVSPIATVLEGSPLPYDDSQVTNGRRYLYEVGAVDSTGLGVLAQVSALPYSAPNRVSPVTVLNIHANALDLFWGVPLSSFPVSFYQVSSLILTFTPTPAGTWFTSTPTPASTPNLQATFALTAVGLATPVATVLGTSFVDSSFGTLGPAAAYYVVQAVDQQGNMSGLPITAAGPFFPHPTAVPAAPALSGMVLATAVPTYGIRLTWNGPGDSEGVTSYQVFAGAVPIATLLVATPSPTYQYDDSSLPFSNSAPTTYKVAALNGNGTKDSNLVVETLTRASVPNPIQVTPDKTQGVTVLWNQGSGGTYGLAGYRIYKSQNGAPTPPSLGFPGTPTFTGSPTPTMTPTPFATLVLTPSMSPTLMALDSGVTNAHGWTYWVEPVDNLNQGGNVGLKATPSYLNLAATPVATVLATPLPATNNQIHVFWSGAAAGFYGVPTDYRLYRNIVAASSPTPIATVPFSQNFFDDFPVGGVGTTVVYRVGVIDEKGNSSDISFTSNPVGLGAQVAPATPAAVAFSGDENALVFNWKDNPASEGVDSYFIYGSDFPSVTPQATPLATVLPTPTLVSFTAPATPWIASFLYVQAHNASGFSPPATLSGFSVPTYQVTAVMTPDARQVRVAWNMAPVLGSSTPEITDFVLYRSSSPGANFTPIASVTVSQSSFVDSTVSPGRTYYYRVTAKASGGGLTAESPIYPTMVPLPEGNRQTWPNAPTGSALASGVNQTTLSWLPNPAAESVQSYVIYHNGVATMTVTPSPTLSFVLSEAPGVASSYNVAAQNAEGSSDLSGTLSVLPPPAITPTVGVAFPAGFTPTPSVTPPPSVWVSGLTYPGSVNDYAVYRSIDPAFSPLSITFVGMVSNPVSYLNDLNPVPGYVNYYKAVAGNGSGLSAVPTLVPATGLDLWPNPPAFDLASSAGAVTVLWATPTGNVPVTAFTLFRNLYPTMTPVVLAQSTPPAASYPDAAVTPGTAYLYWMDAQNGSGTSGLSSPQTIIPLQPPTLSLTPLPGRNTLVWSQVTVVPTSPVTGYVVYRSIPTPGATPTFVPISGLLRGVTVTTFTDSSVQDSLTYVYKVAATTLNNVLSGFSDPVSVTVAPMPVSNLTAVSGDGLVQLRWAYPGTAGNLYVIQRKLGTAPDSDYQTIKNGAVGLDYLDVGLLDKTFYNYRILTVDNLGVTVAGQESTALPAKPPVLPVPPTVSLTQDSDSAQTLIGNTLVWGGANPSGSFNPKTMYPLGGYVVYRSTDGGGVYDLGAGQPGIVPVTLVNGDPASPVTYFDPVTLVGGPTYTYLVQAFDAPPDLPVSVRTNLTQGLVHTANYDLVTAYPVGSNTALDRNAIRPFGASNEQKVNIRFVASDQGRVNIKVYTLNGTFVKELVNADYGPGIHWTSWDATNKNGVAVASGVYLISTESPGGHQEFQKVAVIK